MIKKIKTGIDIEEIQRFRKKPLQKNTTFYNSLFTKSELSRCRKYADPYPHLAGIFCAKEAVIKCLDKSTSMKNIKVSWKPNGKPTVAIGSINIGKMDISISHTDSVAIAVVVILL